MQIADAPRYKLKKTCVTKRKNHTMLTNFSISEQLCDVTFYQFTFPLDETKQFYLHLFDEGTHLNHTLIAQVNFTNNENELYFSEKYCPDFDGSKTVDLYGICDPTSPFSLQKGAWNKIHVTIRRSVNVKEFVAVKPNDHCSYGEDVICIILDVHVKPSVLRAFWTAASVNCISGKFLFS